MIANIRMAIEMAYYQTIEIRGAEQFRMTAAAPLYRVHEQWPKGTAQPVMGRKIESDLLAL